MKRIGDWASRHPWGGISIALVVGIALGVSTTPSGENEAAKADLASAEASYNSSQQELSTAQAETSELESSNANLASEVQNLEGRLDSLSGKLEMIRSRQPLASLLGLTRAQMLEMGDANGWNLIFSKEISSATAGTIISQNPEDVGTGGPDLMRGIFPTVVAISAEGTKEFAEDNLRRLFEELIGERRDQMLLPETHTVDVRRPSKEDS